MPAAAYCRSNAHFIGVQERRLRPTHLPRRQAALALHAVQALPQRHAALPRVRRALRAAAAAAAARAEPPQSLPLAAAHAHHVGARGGALALAAARARHVGPHARGRRAVVSPMRSRWRALDAGRPGRGGRGRF